MATTVIKNANWIIGWDEDKKQHTYLRDADLAFTDDKIIQVGGDYEGEADRVIDGKKLMVMPGFVNVHSHPMSEAMNKGFSEDAGNPCLGNSGLYDLMPVYGPDPDGYQHAATVTYSELLLSGVTTLADLSVAREGWVDQMAESGLRGYISPMFRSAGWYTDNGHSVKYRWSEDGGKKAFNKALATIDEALAHPSGRMSAIMTPSQIDTCTPELFADAMSAARERGIRIQTHAAQSMVEFAEITKRHGLTPIQWLDKLGFLGPETIIAHCIFLDTHSWVTWGSRDDLNILAQSGSHVAHCPNVFIRHGIALEDFGTYRQRGINIGIGTDTFPHNMIEELRAATFSARTVSRRVDGVTSADVFDAATVGGASLLGRDDIGRLAVGAKADLVLVDLDHAGMRPIRDPLRSLIFTAAERAVRDVFVDGTQVVKDRQVLTMDYDKALLKLEKTRDEAEKQVPELDWDNRTIDELCPLSFQIKK